ARPPSTISRTTTTSATARTTKACSTAIATTKALLSRPNLPIAHFKALGPVAEGFEQGLVRPGQPGLAGIGEQFLEQGRAAHGVEVRRRLVDQDERGARADIVGERARLRECQPYEQGF